MENKMDTTIIYRVHVGVAIGIMEKKMETIV